MIQRDELSKNVFQFQYGSIIRVFNILLFYVILKFQFQYGSIISFNLQSRHVGKNIFQFQYGSIIRQIVLAGATIQQDFNSNMVQL